jgi:uncharacterized protein
MRLSEKEKNTFYSTIKKVDPLAQIFLYGSRVSDSLKGGDIDLLVLSEKLTFQEKLTILVEIKEAIGEQKIDLLIANRAQSKGDDFILGILKNAIEIR